MNLTSDDASPHKHQGLVAATVIGAVLFLLLVLVKVADWVLAQDDVPYWMKPNSIVRYEGVDFSSTASINQFGFRGSEQEIQPGQIAAVGDSFTYGWALDDEQTWPELLEQQLRDSGDPREVYNLGTPGSDSVDHIARAAWFAEHYQPSLIILTILLADDLPQAQARFAFERNAATTMREREISGNSLISQLREGLAMLFPGFSRFINDIRDQAQSQEMVGTDDTLNVTDGWKKHGQELAESPELRVTPDVRELLQNGQVNPVLVTVGQMYPDRADFWNKYLQGATTESQTVNKVVEQLESLKSVTDSYGGKIALLAMPSADYVDSEATGNLKKYGFQTSSQSLVSDIPEVGLQTMAEMAEVDVIPTLKSFRDLGRDPFLPIDTHLNDFGAEKIAEIVATYVAGTTKPTK